MRQYILHEIGESPKEEEYYATISEYLSKNLEAASIQVRGLQLLTSVNAQEHVEEILSSGIIKHCTRVMDHYRTNGSLQLLGVKMLLHLAFSRNLRQDIFLSGGLDIAVEAIENFPNHSGIAEDCCDLIYLLSYHLEILQDDEAFESTVSHVVKALAQNFDMHRKCDSVLMKTLRVLNWLVTQSHSVFTS